MIRQLGSILKPSLSAILAILAATQSATAAKPAPNSPPPPFRYKVVYLGTLPEDSRSLAFGVNSSGEVVGYSSNATSGRAFLYRPGTGPGTGMLDLNSVIDPGLNVRLGIALRINNFGQICGQGDAGVPDSQFVFRLTPPIAPATNWTFERVATPGYSNVLGLNLDGDVLFAASLGFYVWPEGGDPIFLGPLGEVTGGLSDRDTANVVQFIKADGVTGTRISFQIGTDPPTLTYQAIGSIGANRSDPYAINAVGHVVGEGLVAIKRTTVKAHAFLKKDDADPVEDIGTLGGEDSSATSINRFDDIIGMAETAQNTGLGDQYDSKFIRTGGLTPKMYDLEKMIDGVQPNELRGIGQISDSRIICGTNDGQTGGQAFVLIPYTPTP